MDNSRICQRLLFHEHGKQNCFSSFDLPAYLGDSCTPAAAPITHIKRVANSRLTNGVAMWLHAENKKENTKLNMNGHILITYWQTEPVLHTAGTIELQTNTTHSFGGEWHLCTWFLLYPKTNIITCSCDIIILYTGTHSNLRIHCCHEIQQIITKLKKFIQDTTKEALQIKWKRNHYTLTSVSTITVCIYMHIK